MKPHHFRRHRVLHRSVYAFLMGVLLAGLAECSSDSPACPAGLAVCITGCGAPGNLCNNPDTGVAPSDAGVAPLDADVGIPDADVGDSSLSGLSVSAGALSPAFSSVTTMYTVQVPFLMSEVQVTATAVDGSATILINGAAVASGTSSGPITIGPRPTMIAVLVQSRGGKQKSYDVVVTRSPNSYLKASNTGQDDRFGGNLSLALSGDTLAVGAPGEDSNATGVDGNQADNSAASSGAVYVFVRAGTSWLQQAYLKASNTEAGDNFGGSLSLSGDTLAVGATGEDSNATGINGNQTDNSAASSGAVYIFVRSGISWAQQAYLKASNTEAGDNFSLSLSLSRDTLAVGANGEDSNATGINGNQSDNSAVSSGAVYVFTRTGTVWAQQTYLKASNTDANDNFGYRLSLSGDSLAVGASLEDSNATGINGNQADNSAASSGAVYVFARTGTDWAQQAYLKASNTEAGDGFGERLSLSADTLAITAVGEDSNATGVNGNQADNSESFSGAVYVFVRSGTTWAQQAYLKASNTERNDYFGFTLSLDGDTLAVGAQFEDSIATGLNGNQADNGSTASGAVYVFDRSGTTWTQRAYVKASNAEANDYFGYSVALSGGTLAVGAIGESSNATGVNGNQADNSASFSGAVYVYR